MPFVKVNLNGRKYVVSGLTERTSSKHILCSLARVDSTFNLETTDLSDSSVEMTDRSKGVRNSRSRTRRTRVHHSSTSSLEIIEWKNGLGSALSKKGNLKQTCVVDAKKSQEWNAEKSGLRTEKCSRKLLFWDSMPAKEKGSLGHSEEQGNGNEKGEVKRRRRKTKKPRPVSQDVASWKDKENGDKIEIGKKGWKSADDVRGKKSSHFSTREKMDAKIERNPKNKQSRKSRNSLCHKNDKKPQNNDQNIVDSIDKPSEYRRVHRHVRQELNKLKIQRMVSRAVDQRLVDFHMASWQSQRFTPQEIQLKNEQDTENKLIQLISSQRKYLSALDKAEKQNKKAMNRYSRYLDLDKEQIQFYNTNFVSDKRIKERVRKTSDTEHDTGISEQHSDSSIETRSPAINDVYKHDVNFSYVISDDVKQNTSATDFKESKNTNLNDLNEDDVIIDDVSATEVKISKVYDVHDNDVTVEFVRSDDVITTEIKKLESRDVINDDTTTCENLSKNILTNDDLVKVDATAEEDVINDVNTFSYTKEDASEPDVIVARQTEIVSFDQSEIGSAAITSWSAGSITTSTLSDVSDSCCHSNTMDPQINEIEGLKNVLMKEKERQQHLKQKIDRLCGEMRLIDLRTQEQNKMADVLGSLKSLNHGLVKDEIQDESDDETLKREKKSLEKSIKLSINLYEYQKGEINDNALGLQIIESQIKRKRWHVESAVRDLGQFVTSSLRTQLERIQSLEEIEGIKTSIVFKPQLNGTLV